MDFSVSKKQNFVHLHVHSDYSILDGLGNVANYIARAVELGQPALALTDHGNVGGTPLFYRVCREAGIQPILGQEFYFVPDVVKYKDMKGERFHIGIIARNRAGYATLVELSTEGHRNFGAHKTGKPVIERDTIRALSKKERSNLVVLSGCAASIISRKLLGTTPGDADKEIRWWSGAFKHFYIELMHHDTSFDRRLNGLLAKAARRHGIPWVITNDPHFVLEEECDAHDALLAIQTAAEIDDPERFRFDGEGYWLKSAKEMKKAFKSYGEGIWVPGAAATMEIARDCAVSIPEFESKAWHIPKYPYTDDAYKMLKGLVVKGLKKKKRGKKRLIDIPEYVDRAKMELRRIKKVTTENGTGMADFLLITWDLIEHARNTLTDSGRPIRVGPGRGSVAGCLVAYLIDIHKVDPVRYGLMFERFLNPERPKMPDIDTDFSARYRDIMLRYFPERYGEENTQPVAAFGTMQMKRAFRTLASAHGIEWTEINKLADEIVEDEDGENYLLPERVREDYPRIEETMDRFIGLKASPSSHPAGVIIFDPEDPVRDLVPLMWIPDRQGKPGRFVSQYNLEIAEAIYLLKQDALALRALDTIEDCLVMIEERHGVVLDPDSWIPDEEKHDKAIYRMLANGDTAGVFQLEGGAMHRGIQAMKCKSFEDIVMTTAVFRAGPMKAGSDKRLMKNRSEGKVRVAHKSLREILSISWGEMIYDEQMLQMLNEAAGLSWARADDVKNAMKKKDPKLMVPVKADAVKGFRKTAGMSKETAEEVWSQIEAQSRYLFNRSHAVAYSILSYQTARLKFLYPLEFYTALMRTVDPKSKEAKAKRERYLSEAASKGFKIVPPDINLSEPHFTAQGDDTLMFGLQDAKYVGAKLCERIMAWREENGSFKSVSQVASAINNSKAVSVICGIGGCQGLKGAPKFASEKQQEEFLGWIFGDGMADYRPKYENKIVRPGDGRRGNVLLYGEITKIERRTTKAGKEFCTWKIRWRPGEEYGVTLWDDASGLWNVPKGSIVRVRGYWKQDYRNVGVGDTDQVKVISRAA